MLSKDKAKRFLLLIALPLLLAALNACVKNPAKPVSESRLMMDTFCSITVYGENSQSLLEEAFLLCEKYEAMFSRTHEGSEIWRLNHADGAALEVSPQTFDIIKAGMYYAELSDGRFDITVGRLSSLWDFGGEPSLPAENDIAKALSTIGYNNISLTDSAVRLDNKAWLDLGAIAKGYIADRVADLLRIRGVRGAIIDLGGNIVTVGEKPDGSPWRIGVRKPFGGQNESIGILETSECSVVTSGTYERWFIENEVRYHHILDTATGFPAESDIVSATVISAESAAGDAFSTIFLLAGSDEAESLLEKHPEITGVILTLETGEIRQYGDIAFIPAEFFQASSGE